MVSLSSRISPLTLTVIFLERSPPRDRRRHFRDVAHLRGQVARHEVDVVGEVLPRARDARDLRLTTELAVRADLARDARHFAGERVELVHHRVDGVLQLENLAAHVDRDLARQVAAGHRGRHFGDVAHLVGQVARHRVHRVGQVLPRAGDTGHHRLTTQSSFCADFLRDARDFRRKRPQLIDHRVDGFLQLQNFSTNVDRDLARQVAAGDRDRDLRDVANLRRQVAGHRVDAVGEVLPDAADVANLRLTAQLAVGADLARHARHFGGEHAQLLDHRVDDGGGAEELAFERPAVHVEPDGLEQVALRDGGERARHFRRRPEQVVDQRVDRRLHLAPRAGRTSELDALPRLPLFADDRADSFELARHAGVGGDDLVEGVGDLAFEARPVTGQAHREVAVAYGLQRAKQLRQLRVRRASAQTWRKGRHYLSASWGSSRKWGTRDCIESQGARLSARIGLSNFPGIA